MSFQKELQEKLGEHTPSEVEEWILDGLIESVDTLTEEQMEGLSEYSSLMHLSMNGIGWTSLHNFPRLENLQILEISNNKLTGKDLKSIATLYPNLYKINLCDNQIASIDMIKPLLNNTNIVKIAILNNPCLEHVEETYKRDLFNQFKKLTVIDGEDREGNEVDSTIYGDDEEENESDEEIDEEDDEEDGEFDEEDDEEDEEDGDDDEDEEEPVKKRKK